MCNCYVRGLSSDHQIGLIRGAHSHSCPVYVKPHDGFRRWCREFRQAHDPSFRLATRDEITTMAAVVESRFHMRAGGA